MAKPSPYFKTPEEAQELARLRDAFKFDEPRTNPAYLILIAGPEASGKTHTACTMSEVGPVYLLDSEYRADIVTKKFQNVKHKVVRSYKDIIVAVKAIIKNCPKGTIVFDSGTDLQTFAELDYLEETHKSSVGLPWNWPEVWSRCNAVVDDCRFSDFTIVVTARVKDEYNGDKPSGKVIPRIYSTLPYKADIGLQLSKEKGKTVATLIKNGFTNTNGITLPAEINLPLLIKQLSSIT